MKNVVIISGSIRKGNTLAIAEIYSKEFETAGFSTKLISLSDQQYAYCNGCLACDETQECIIEDGFETVIEDIRNADLIVFGTPTRWRLLSGELKSFIDRLNPYAAVEGYAGLKAFVYAVGQSDEDAVDSINSAVESICSFAMDAGMDILGRQSFCNLLGEQDYINSLSNIRAICKENVQSVTELMK